MPSGPTLRKSPGEKFMKSMLIWTPAVGCGRCGPQTAAHGKPNALNRPETKYGGVYPENRTMFRAAFPDARKVPVRTGRGSGTTKGAGRSGSAETTPLTAGFHHYFGYFGLQIDGATVANPSTMPFFGSGWQNRESGFPSRTRTRSVPAEICLVPHAPGMTVGRTKVVP
jgi:hypothetical protein